MTMQWTSKKIQTAGALKSQRGVEGNSFKKRLSYQLKTGKLVKLRKGLYVLGDQLENLGEDNLREIANRMYVPSYISYETALQFHHVSFQNRQSITVATRYHKEIPIPKINLTVQCFSVNEHLLSDPFGIQRYKDVYVASAERAICDVIHRSGTYYFDNVSDIDTDRLQNIAEMYRLYCRGFVGKFQKFFTSYFPAG